jgi:hypothetical protein
MTPLWPIGLSTGCFYRHSIFSVLEEIRANGFELIEVCSFPKNLTTIRRMRCGGQAR